MTGTEGLFYSRRPRSWLGYVPLAVLVIAALFFIGMAVGRKTAPPCCVYFKWLYDAHPSDTRMSDSGQNVVLFGTRGRIWTARIRLASCQQYRRHHGYPPCPKAARNPNRYVPDPPQ